MGNTAATATTSSQQDTAPLPSDCLVVKLREADMVDGRGRTKPYSKGTVVEIGYDGIIDNECAKKGDREKHYYDDSNPPPENANILLHSCCAPCSGAMFEEMLKQKYNITIFSTIQTFTQGKSMRFAKKKTRGMHGSTRSLL